MIYVVAFFVIVFSPLLVDIIAGLISDARE